AGKHILVEKPIALNVYETQVMIEAATANKVFLMEAYMYRCHPQTARLVDLLREKAIGDVRVIQATFSFHAGFDPNSRLWSNALAGGGIMDVGGYTTSIARLIAGAALGLPFADPISVAGAGHLHPETGVDEWALATLRFPNDIVANLATGVGVNQENVVRIFGSAGNILVPDPYVCWRDGAMPGRIIVNRNGQPPEEILLDSPVTSLAHEADVCGRAIRGPRGGCLRAGHPRGAAAGRAPGHDMGRYARQYPHPGRLAVGRRAYLRRRKGRPRQAPHHRQPPPGGAGGQAHAHRHGRAPGQARLPPRHGRGQPGLHAARGHRLR
ncbi:MAG: Gfo/Idh/MocA family oxidoreductase, partial [Planctomycetota bacterium]|nr:Gfo/Idh/MocA family oxidoreductase [Planctomycetota bacterium]